MATYSTERGFTIQSLASDPPAPVQGQVWYNTTTTVLKGYSQSGTGAWASGNNINSARYYSGAGGTQTAAWLAGGSNMLSPPAYKLHEQYDGTSWSTSTDMGTARYHVSGCGSITAILCYGGGPPPGLSLVEQWNGSTWTEVADLGTGRYGINSSTSGTTSATMAAGGYQSWPVTSSPAKFAGTEEWNSPVLAIKTVTTS